MHRALGRKQGYPWCGHFIRLPRLKDWLALLGFEVAGGRFAAYAPPLHHTKWLESFSFINCDPASEPPAAMSAMIPKNVISIIPSVT